ncbi:4Fe-4S binding protein [Lachnoclostridium pacaense]|uniref:ATP-binding protein n=1 Tax=Enterocloster hominis (ex Hitch et al. 2024) TaxID=1917870 RepID=UPI001D1183F4|nr:4Fe-4S binding protein [Lachnoclostridium pacaense]MCC2877440.1 4Fe-4S binding protein [Lachnoclostridium pacaense]
MKPQSKSIAYIHRDSCVACGCCLKVCPRQALDIWKGSYAIVSHDLCVGCGKCARECPASVIDIVPRHTDTQDLSSSPITSASPEKGGARHEQ